MKGVLITLVSASPLPLLALNVTTSFSTLLIALNRETRLAASFPPSANLDDILAAFSLKMVMDCSMDASPPAAISLGFCSGVMVNGIRLDEEEGEEGGIPETDAPKLSTTSLKPSNEMQLSSRRTAFDRAA